MIEELRCARDWSKNTAKAGALGHRERQSDRRKLLSATMSPMASACGVVAESPTASVASRGAQKNKKKENSKRQRYKHFCIYFCKKKL